MHYSFFNATIYDMQLASLPAPFLQPDRDYCLFLGFDGTLVDLDPVSREVQVESRLILLLAQIAADLQGAVAIMTCRSSAEIDSLLAPLYLPVAGMHGYERRSGGCVTRRGVATDPRLDGCRVRFREFSACHAGLFVIDHGVAIALHFPSEPHLKATLEQCAAELMSDLGGGYRLAQGNAMIEIRSPLCDKAFAVDAFMYEAPFYGRVPIYIGGEFEDRDGLAAMQKHNGFAIAVGAHVSTKWRLRDPSAVHSWLHDFQRMSVRKGNKTGSASRNPAPASSAFRRAEKGGRM